MRPVRIPPNSSSAKTGLTENKHQEFETEVFFDCDCETSSTPRWPFLINFLCAYKKKTEEMCARSKDNSIQRTIPEFYLLQEPNIVTTVKNSAAERIRFWNCLR